MQLAIEFGAQILFFSFFALTLATLGLLGVVKVCVRIGLLNDNSDSSSALTEFLKNFT